MRRVATHYERVIDLASSIQGPRRRPRG
jgi:hypothetical protein